jgi:hypothetical protein
MLLHLNKILFVILHLFIFILSSIRCNIHIFRKLNESYSTTENNINSDYKSDEFDEIDVICYNYTDCFNCTINPYCRWIMSNYSCIKFEPYNENYSIITLNETYENNTKITLLNQHINFIRKVCFLPLIPYTENNNSNIYNNISAKYCGSHYITTPLEKFENEFKIELKNVRGVYGLPNILCEYIILSGPSGFDTNVEIDKNEAESFYLLYSEDSQYFSALINESKTINVGDTGRRANTFIFYGLKSFNTSPFKITFKKNISKKDSQTLGYIFIGIVIALFFIVVTSIIYIRLNSIIFKKKGKNINEEEEKFKESNIKANFLENKEQSELMENLENKNKSLSTNDINKNSDLLGPNKILLNNQNYLSSNNIKTNESNNINNGYICSYDNQIINNINELFTARCGHFYHLQCFNQLVNIGKFQNAQIQCISCPNIIYP